LLYLAPFIGGILGSAIAGKLSDIICRFMARRNGGIFEPEFRLIMVALVALSTVTGLWGFGWSSQVQDPWIAPTVFFGVIGFGCTLGSTVSVSFVVDSYRADAGSSLTTLNFSKNLVGISVVI
jgi:MFS family permease